MQLGESLKQWREYRHYSLSDVARMSGVDRNTIYRTEEGRHAGMRWDDLYKVATVLGIETLAQLAQGVAEIQEAPRV